MRRLAPILTSILIGAIAVAVGMGIYLKKANLDRERLASVAADAERKAGEATDASRKAIEGANAKLAAANAEIAKAQAALKSLQEERDLMATAKVLETPKPSLVRGWKEAVDLQLGVSLKYPPQNDVDTSDAQSLTISRVGTDADPSADLRWFSLTPYDERLENELLANFSTSTFVTYLAHGRLVAGRRGTVTTGTENVYVLKVRSGEVTYLIWAKSPDRSAGDDSRLLQVLATLDFKSK